MHHLWIGYLSSIQQVRKSLVDDEAIRHGSYTLIKSPQDLEGWRCPITIHICWPGLRTLTPEMRKSWQRLQLTNDNITIVRHK